MFYVHYVIITFSYLYFSPDSVFITLLFLQYNDQFVPMLLISVKSSTKIVVNVNTETNEYSINVIRLTGKNFG